MGKAGSIPGAEGQTLDMQVGGLRPVAWTLFQLCAALIEPALHLKCFLQLKCRYVQVLEGLETYIATEDFLHKLEQASAEWIDLSEHEKQQQASDTTAGGLEHTQVRLVCMQRC
jgi:hypothetical protein